MLVTRTHRSAPPTAAAVRASAGALLHLPHARVANLSRALDRLRDAGFTTIGLDGEAPRSVFDEPCPEGRVALVVGSEGAGISRLVREHCDLLVSLPMHGKVGSLNAAASLAAVLYALRAGGPRRERRMNDEPGAAPEPEEPPPARSRYEDFDLADLQAGQQHAPRPTGRRTPTLTVAAIVLAVSGVMPILVVIGFRPGGGAAVALLAWGVLCLVAAALVVTLQPIGRPLGIAVGCIGVVIGVRLGAPLRGERAARRRAHRVRDLRLRGVGSVVPAGVDSVDPPAWRSPVAQPTCNR